jgi:hypothetical protein
MSVDSSSIDVSALAELVRIRQEEEVLRGRLEKMELSKERVSQVVFHRVREDYEKRKTVLDAERRAPREQAGRQFAKLRVLLTDAGKSLEEARFQNEEMEFRHELGEFAEVDYKARLGECQARLSERQKALDKLTDLKKEFQNAFSSEEELERAASESATAEDVPEALPRILSTVPRPPEAPQSSLVPPAPPAPPVPQIPSVPPVPPAQEARRTFATLKPVTTDSAVVPDTIAMAIPPMIPPPPVRPLQPAEPDPADATVVSAASPARRGSTGNPSANLPVPGARLILLIDDKPQREFLLKREPMSIGRATESEIQIPYPDVSRFHASITPDGKSGFKLTDRGSPNGIIVNSELVKEHLLLDGDIIQIGRRKLVFRA